MAQNFDNIEASLQLQLLRPGEPIAVDVACPNCHYNLRTLSGPVVTCPECGKTSDVRKLDERPWAKLWWATPEFKAVSLSVVVGAVMHLACLFTLLFMFASRFSVTMGLVVICVATGVWGATLYRSWRQFGGSEGLLLSLLLSATFAFMVVSGIALMLSIIMLCVALFSSPVDTTPAAIWSGVLAASFALLYGSRKIERFVARRCLRAYLQKRSRHDSPDRPASDSTAQPQHDARANRDADLTRLPLELRLQLQLPDEPLTVDVACPHCGGNLRGQRGPAVTCPACGQTSDVMSLVDEQRWMKLRWTMPTFKVILTPAVVVIIGLVAALVCAMVVVTTKLSTPVGACVYLSVTLMVLAAWGVTVRRAWQWFGGVEGLRLSLLLHVVFAGMAVGLFAAFGGALGFLALLAPGRSPVWIAMICGGCLLAGGLLMYGSWRIDRFVARRCLKVHLGKISQRDPQALPANPAQDGGPTP